MRARFILTKANKWISIEVKWFQATKNSKNFLRSFRFLNMFFREVR